MYFEEYTIIVLALVYAWIVYNHQKHFLSLFYRRDETCLAKKFLEEPPLCQPQNK